MGECDLILTKVYDNRKMKQMPKMEDEYIEKMAEFYTSEAALKIFPYLHDIPFERWLYQQWALRMEGSEGSCVKANV